MTQVLESGLQSEDNLSYLMRDEHSSYLEHWSFFFLLLWSFNLLINLARYTEVEDIFIIEYSCV